VTAAAGGADARVPGYLGRVLDGGGAPVGTCFQVAPGVLVTAWHVLDDIGAAADGACVRIDPLAGGEAFDAAVARLDSRRDLAVLTCAASLPAVAGPLWATDRVPLRVQATVTGHAVPDDPGHLYRFLDAPGEWAGGTTRDEEVLLGRMTSRAVVPEARRLGMGAGLPQPFLEAAVPGYLTDTKWDALGEDWLEQALAYTVVPCKGAGGPLTRPHPRPALPAVRNRGDQPASTTAVAGPLYRLADYLDQHGRSHRASQIPPAEFWSAAAAHAATGDQAALGDAAHDRGLYRAAAQLHKNAAASGNRSAAFYLSRSLACLRADPRPAHWAAAHAALDDPYAVADLLDSLREADAHDQAAALLASRAAAHAPLDHPRAVALLLDGLRRAGARKQAAALASRAAAHVPLDDPGAVADLLDGLRRAGARKQTAALAGRIPLDDPGAVALLLFSLREKGAHDQVAALLARDPAARAALDDPGKVAELLDSLGEGGAHDQVAALLARDPAAHAPLDNPWAVARLLDSLREGGAHDQVAALLARDPAAHAALDDPGAVALLLFSLRETGAHDQVAALASRAAAHAPLNYPDGVGFLLRSGESPVCVEHRSRLKLPPSHLHPRNAHRARTATAIRCQHYRRSRGLL
jgi:hypothetical protein